MAARPGTGLSSSAVTLTSGQGPTIVCDHLRFKDLGLDMKSFPFCDKSLSYGVRVKDLIDRMTLVEKVGQIGDQATGVPRLGLPKYDWWSEALHGVAYVGHGTHFDDIVPAATSFPEVILMAASFNESLWKAIGQVVSTEARAMNNLGLAGLTFWSPNINVARDPRWGRIMETPGEDPYTVGRYAVNYVRGLQDVEGTTPGTNTTEEDLNTRPLKVAACCKHYAAYDVDNWQGVDRYHFDARVTERDMLETFVRPFEMCVRDGDVSSVMCSYNRVNGIPTCADPKLLSETIRGEWNLHGYIVSDCDSLEVMHHGHKFLNDTPEDTVAQTLRAGLDLDCGLYFTKYTNSSVSQGKVRQADIDKALNNLYMVLMRLGFFDGSPVYAGLGKSDVCSDSNIELAAEAAREGIVLLNNSMGGLPLNKLKHKNVVVVGPHGNASNAMIGNYEGYPCRNMTPLIGLSEYANVSYEPGCADINCLNMTLFHRAVTAAKNADATILLMGIDLSVEAEGRDRNDLLLPGYQHQLISEIADAAKGPVILVILSAGGVDISFAMDNPNVSAVVWAGYPGGEGGRAIADVIYGHYNPGGRLPITWYQADYVHQFPMTSMPLRPIDDLGYPGRTYKFFSGKPLFPFGYGLSYTSFNYTLKTATKSLAIHLGKYVQCRQLSYAESVKPPPCPAALVSDLSCAKTFEIEVIVQNVGTIGGSHVVMVYTVPPSGLLGMPLKQLVGFQRVFVSAGGSEVVKFKLNGCQSFTVVEETAYQVVPAGVSTVLIGDDKVSVSFPLELQLHY
ncbi:beta-xylosidase/alpha-L-arabinofuranosidase 1 [Amborella trichopoda]|nr:beta-xylosidase/alpha-L-arabinofuranosidase 1 [Amborella trichopoda]|eukprot:XP_006858943.2 beta-xylosidase/alpha-L-arabinofuranosidase 1 [Amborella trichopoda]